jgi:signal transduction histidine kinase
MLADIGDMEAMLSDTLAFAGAEMRREREQVIDLAALLISLADTFSDTGETVQYDGPDHLTITCRPVAIKRAFTNLIANGCQYGEAVQIRLSAASNVAIVDIVDRGPGIPAEEAERAFEPFERLEASRSRESGGTGLGLTIAREAVIGQGGGIAFIHDPEGFTVRVTLALDR